MDLSLFSDDKGGCDHWNPEVLTQLSLSLLYEALKEWNYIIGFFYLKEVREEHNASLDMERLWGGETGITRAQRMDQLLYYFSPGDQMDEHLEHIRIFREDVPSGDEIRAVIYEGNQYNLKRLRLEDEEDTGK